MIITFIGHSSLYNCKDLHTKIENAIIKNTTAEGYISFYCGGYGDFDNLCASICRSIKEKMPRAEIVFITPYITEAQQKKLMYLIDNKLYDSIIYPPLEKVPAKFAICKRNEWMIDQSELIIAFVKRTHGGAFKALEYARKKKKVIINLADTD